MTHTTDIPVNDPRIQIIGARKHMTLKVWIPKSDARSLMDVLGIAASEVLGILPELSDDASNQAEGYWVGTLDMRCRNIEHDLLEDLEDSVHLLLSEVDKVTACLELSYVTRDLSSIGQLVRRVIAGLPHAEMEWSAYSESEQMLETKRYRAGEVWFASAWYPPIVEPEDEPQSGQSDTPGSPSSDSPDVPPPYVPF